MNSAGTDYVNALCARDYKGIGNQDIGGGKLICQRMEDISKNIVIALDNISD